MLADTEQGAKRRTVMTGVFGATKFAVVAFDVPGGHFATRAFECQPEVPSTSSEVRVILPCATGGEDAGTPSTAMLQMAMAGGAVAVLVLLVVVVVGRKNVAKRLSQLSRVLCTSMLWRQTGVSRLPTFAVPDGFKTGEEEEEEEEKGRVRLASGSSEQWPWQDLDVSREQSKSEPEPVDNRASTYTALTLDPVAQEPKEASRQRTRSRGRSRGASQPRARGQRNGSAGRRARAGSAGQRGRTGSAGKGARRQCWAPCACGQCRKSCGRCLRTGSCVRMLVFIWSAARSPGPALAQVPGSAEALGGYHAGGLVCGIVLSPGVAAGWSSDPWRT